MSTTDPQSTGSPPAGPTCGNCGAAVESTSVICPACGVLLAAYQAALGSSSQSEPSSGAASSATQSVPGADSSGRYRSSATGPSTVPPGSAYQSPPPPPTLPPAPGSTPSYATPPIHQPRSQSPIGDALRSSHAGMMSALHPDSLVASDAPAEELSRMASADDDLADMADGEDELADMASGQDELARMASGGKATLAEQVEAELSGATVRFDGSAPVIEAAEASVTNPGEGEPEVVEEHPPSPPVEDAAPVDPAMASTSDRPDPPIPSTPSRSQVSTPTPDATRQKYQAPAIDWVSSGKPQTSAHTSAKVGTPAAYPDPASKQLAITRAALIGCLPFLLVFSVITWIFQGGNSGSIFFGVLFIGGLFYLLLRATGSTSRKTTSMPVDTSWNSKRKR